MRLGVPSAGADLEGVTARLRSAARRCVGDDLCEIEAAGAAFLWLHGSTLLEAVPHADGSVLLRAFLVLGPPDDGGLEERLASFAQHVPVGRLVLDDEGDIALERRVGPGAPRERLERAIREISSQADRLDDLLCGLFGGVRSVDRLRREVAQALVQPN
jgi:hypothetical protein